VLFLAGYSTSTLGLHHAKAPTFYIENNHLLAERLIAEHAAHPGKAHQHCIRKTATFDVSNGAQQNQNRAKLQAGGRGGGISLEGFTSEIDYSVRTTTLG
jgi:hypothetical protein